MNKDHLPSVLGWTGDAKHLTELRHIDMTGESGLARGSGFTDLLGAIRRSLVPLAIWIVVCLAGTGIYLSQVKPQFVSSTQVVLDPRRPVAPDPTTTFVSQSLDSAQAESQTQVVKSERILRFVFDTLDLVHDPAYADEEPGLLSRLLGSVRGDAGSGSASSTDTQAAARAFQNFANRVDVRRIGQSYVLEISFRADSPQQAVRLANAITASYILDQINFRAASVQRGSEFLQNRIADIKMEQEAATAAVKNGAFPPVQFVDSDARIVSAALEPLGKSYPRTKLVLLLAGIFALLSGIGVVALRHGLDRKIRSREQLGHALGVDAIAALPRARQRDGFPRGRPSIRSVIDQPDSEFARMFRVMRAALYTSAARQKMTIGIMSCRRGEGRSTVAANLACLLAGTSGRVILVDGDLTKPDLSRTLTPQAGVGLTTLLASRNRDPVEPTVMLTDTLGFAPALRSGESADPNLFLGSDLMEGWLTRLRTDFDVVIDLPALSQSSDAQAIGHLLDGVIFLVEAGRTTLDEVAEALRVLTSANVRLLGVVLNKAASTSRHR